MLKHRENRQASDVADAITSTKGLVEKEIGMDPRHQIHMERARLAGVAIREFMNRPARRSLEKKADTGQAEVFFKDTGKRVEVTIEKGGQNA